MNPPKSDIVTNRTSDYIRAHADIEHDAGSSVTIAEVLDGNYSSLRFTGLARVEEIAEACRTFSTEEHEVVARISWVSGKPVVALHRERRPAGLDALLRYGSGAPLTGRQ